MDKESSENQENKHKTGRHRESKDQMEAVRREEEQTLRQTQKQRYVEEKQEKKTEMLADMDIDKTKKE